VLESGQLSGYYGLRVRPGNERPVANDPKPTFVDLKQGEAAARALNVSSHFVDPLRKSKRGKL
jgi:hypothetical protein